MAIDTVEQWRSFLAEEAEKLAGGESTAAKTNALSNLAGKVFQSVKLEVEYNRILGTTPNIKFFEGADIKKLISNHD